MSSTTPNTSSGGVRNLRAMFENKGGDIEASPPSRGRSPAASDASAHSRPISKVRASFVAVERPGDLGPSGQQWGLRKASDVSSMAEVKEEALRDDEGGANSHTSADKAATEAVEEIPEVNGSSNKPSQNASKTETNGTLGKATKSSAIASKGEKPSEAKTKTTSSTSKPHDAPKAKPTSDKSTVVKQTKTTERAKDVDHAKKEAARPAKINTSKDSTTTDLKRKPSKISTTSKPSMGSPTMPRTPKTPKTPSSAGTVKPPIKGSPNKPAAVTKSAAQAQAAAGSKQDKTPQKPSRTSLAPSTTASKRESTTSTAKSLHEPNHEAKAEHLKPGETITTGGFVKPRPKSPTRPARLPAAAMSSTTSSSAKTGSATEGSSLGRKPSTLKRDRVPPTTTTNRSLDKKTSRASLSHFDSHKAHAEEKERSRSRMSTSTAGRATDDGFLARMMRPTASSSQKVHDKIESMPSPPRRREVSGSSKTDAKPHHHEPHHHEESRRVSTAPKKISEHLATSHPKKEEPKKDIKPTKQGNTTKEDKPHKEETKLEKSIVSATEPKSPIETKPESKKRVTHEPEQVAKGKEELVQATPALIAEPKAADVIPSTSNNAEVEHGVADLPATPAKLETITKPHNEIEDKPTNHVQPSASTTQPEAKIENSLPEPSHPTEAEKAEDLERSTAPEPIQPAEEEKAQEEEPEQDIPIKEPDATTDPEDIAMPPLEAVDDKEESATGEGVEERIEAEEDRNEEVEKWKEEEDEKKTLELELEHEHDYEHEHEPIEGEKAHEEGHHAVATSLGEEEEL